MVKVSGGQSRFGSFKTTPITQSELNYIKEEIEQPRRPSTYRTTPSGTLSSQSTRYTGEGVRRSALMGSIYYGTYKKEEREVYEERKIVPGKPTQVKEKEIINPRPEYAGVQPSRLQGSVISQEQYTARETGTPAFRQKAETYLARTQPLKTPTTEKPSYVSPTIKQYGGVISGVGSPRTSVLSFRQAVSTKINAFIPKKYQPTIEKAKFESKEFFKTIGGSFKYAFYESPKGFLISGASSFAPYLFPKSQRPIVSALAQKEIKARKGEIFTTGLVTASFFSPIVPTVVGLVYLPSSIKSAIQKPSGSTFANVTLSGVGALGVFPYIRRAGVKLIGTEIPSEKVFAKEVLSGKSQFPRTTGPKASVLAFEKVRTKEGIPTAHVTPASFGAEEVLARGTSHEAGLYVTPYGKGSPYFTYLPEPSATPKLSLLPGFSTPQLIKVGVERVRRIPEKVIRTKGFEQVNKFLESQAGKKTAYISKRSEARFRPELQGRFATTSELEAIIPAGTKIQRVSKGNFLQRLAGFKYYTTYRGEVIPIKEYGIVGGKVSKSEFAKQQSSFKKASYSLGEIKRPRIEIKSYPYKTIRPTERPIMRPTFRPTTRPTVRASVRPSVRPAVRPSMRPVIRPSIRPSFRPSMRPAVRPTMRPVIRPSIRPSLRPILRPSLRPTIRPSVRPSIRPPIQVFKEKNFFKFSKPSKRKLRVKQPRKYSPTFWAVTGKVKLPKGMKRRTKELSGLEVRPL